MAIESFGYNEKCIPILRNQGNRIDRDGSIRIRLSDFEKDSPLVMKFLSKFGITRSGTSEAKQVQSASHGVPYYRKGIPVEGVDQSHGTLTGGAHEERDRVNRNDSERAYVPLEEFPDPDTINPDTDPFFESEDIPRDDEEEDFRDEEGGMSGLDTSDMMLTLNDPDTIRRKGKSGQSDVNIRVRGGVQRGTSPQGTFYKDGRVLRYVSPEQYEDLWIDREGWTENLETDGGISADYNPKLDPDNYADSTGYNDLQDDRLSQRTSIRAENTGQSYNTGYVTNDDVRRSSSKTRPRNEYSRSNEHRGPDRGLIRKFLGKLF
jgi:hypothetical protein